MIVHLVIGIMKAKVAVIDLAIGASLSGCDLSDDILKESLILVDIDPAGRHDLLRFIELEGMDDLHRLPLTDIYISILFVIPGVTDLPIDIFLPSEIPGGGYLVKYLI